MALSGPHCGAAVGFHCGAAGGPHLYGAAVGFHCGAVGGPHLWRCRRLPPWRCRGPTVALPWRFPLWRCRRLPLWRCRRPTLWRCRRPACGAAGGPHCGAVVGPHCGAAVGFHCGAVGGETKACLDLDSPRYDRPVAVNFDAAYGVNESPGRVGPCDQSAAVVWRRPRRLRGPSAPLVPNVLTKRALPRHTPLGPRACQVLCSFVPVLPSVVGRHGPRPLSPSLLGLQSLVFWARCALHRRCNTARPPRPNPTIRCDSARGGAGILILTPGAGAEVDPHAHSTVRVGLTTSVRYAPGSTVQWAGAVARISDALIDDDALGVAVKVRLEPLDRVKQPRSGRRCSGWRRSGWRRSGWPRSGWRRAGWLQSWPRSGWPRAGWRRSGWRRAGWRRAGWRRAGWPRSGWPAQVGVAQVGVAQVGPAQVGPAQVGPAQVGPAQVGPAQVGPGLALQVGLPGWRRSGCQSAPTPSGCRLLGGGEDRARRDLISSLALLVVVSASLSSPLEVEGRAYALALCHCRQPVTRCVTRFAYRSTCSVAFPSVGGVPRCTGRSGTSRGRARRPGCYSLINSIQRGACRQRFGGGSGGWRSWVLLSVLSAGMFFDDSIAQMPPFVKHLC